MPGVDQRPERHRPVLAIVVDELFGGLQCPACAGAEILGGTTVVIPGGLGTTGRDFVLDPASRIAGRVTDVASGAPLANVAVNVYASGGAAHPVGTATTGVDGSYEVRGLPAATHFASTANAPRHLNEIFNDVPCAAGIGTPGATTSTGAALVVNGTLTGVDFALTQRYRGANGADQLVGDGPGFRRAGVVDGSGRRRPGDQLRARGGSGARPYRSDRAGRDAVAVRARGQPGRISCACAA